MRIAIIGCGSIAGSHIRILTRVRPNSKIYLCDIDKQRAEELARRYTVEEIFTQAGDVLRSVKPDAVHITTPPRTHASLAEHALLAGCHVFVEKPATETLEEYTRIAALAKDQSRVLCGDYSVLGMPVVMKAMDTIRSGRLGGLVSVHCDFAGSEAGGVIPYKDPHHWAYRLWGGILQNMIDHPAALVLAAMDPIEDHSFFVARRNMLPFDSPDFIHVSVRSRDQMGSFTLSLGHGCNERKAHFLLEGGSILTDMGRQLYSCITGSGPQSFIKKGTTGISQGCAFAGGTVKNMVRACAGKLQRDPGIVHVMEAFYSAIERGTQLLVTHENILAITKLLQEIWKKIGYRAPYSPAEEME
jgi:predicted dehydrogenase